ncbi:MAG: dihydropteroate synthase [Paludibacteraceae bacterium]|nr:dihydropteroate synthase [Paludibacteraceae bacterium]
MLSIRSYLLTFAHPLVMGIVNVTPDSFACRAGVDERSITDSIISMAESHPDIIDIGGCSTRPGGVVVTEEEEWQRVAKGLAIVRKVYPHIPVSIDTFRATIAARAIEQFSVDMINDVSGLEDAEMLQVLSRARTPYILTHPRSACVAWTASTDVMSELVAFFQTQLDRLHHYGVADVIIDPGLGFGKTVEQNYTILNHLDYLRILDVPVLVGISRKSMLCQPLQIEPSQALNATTTAQTVALMHGADILRVHDVVPAKQTIQIIQQLSAVRRL